jgi:hypothetical protein
LSEPGAPRRVVIRFAAPRSIGPASLVALEDYARELTRARAAEALAAEADATQTCGLALESPLVAPEGDVLADIEAFARDLAEREGPGLGWS